MSKMKMNCQNKITLVPNLLIYRRTSLDDTVVVLFANERPAGYADTAGSPVFDYDVIGSGRFAMATTDGFWIGTWSRATLV